MDGGYYAIKGFEFQIDKTILEILDTEDDVSLENKQDINTDNFVIQVKYKETQDYSDNKIREPVIQLIEEFKEDKAKEYKLFCYFKNKEEKTEVINITQLNSILSKIKETEKTSKKSKELNSRISSIDENTKKEFIKKFCIVFAKEYQEQFEQVIKKLRTEIFYNISYDEAIFYYSNVTNLLRKLVINTTDITKRYYSKKLLIEYIKNNKKLIFDSSFREYKGEKEYFNIIKERFVKPRKNSENYIFIGNIEIDNSTSIDNLLISVLDEYYKKATCDIKPLTLIVNNELIEKTKRSLINKDFIFNDGYENIQFKSDLFFRSPIINKKTSGKKVLETLDDISFKLRVLSHDTFEKISNHKIIPDMIYYLDSKINIEFNDSSFISINGLNTKQIKELFTNSK